MMQKFSSLDKLIIFDLDDTLYREFDFLLSGYHHISDLIGLKIIDEMIELYRNKCNVFETIISKYNLDYSIDDLVKIYREHSPQLTLAPEVRTILNLFKSLNYKMALVTDGYSITQRNKIRELELENYFDKLVISEEIGTVKPNPNNYSFFLNFLKKNVFVVGDNPKKDFYFPNSIGWQTICLLDSGENIHKQDFSLEISFLPKIYINSFNDLTKIIL